MNLRAFKAIFRQAFGRNKGGAKASPMAFRASLIFIMAFILLVGNIAYGIVPFWKNHYGPKEANTSILVVNPPVSFKEFRRGWDKDLIYTYHDALFDFITFDKLMHENNAYMALVFPEDFDKDYHDNIQSEILTYVRTDKHIYATWRDTYVDTELEDYQDFLKADLGIPLSDENFKLDYYKITTTDMPYRMYFVHYTGQILVPLIAFIVMLYISMSKGTNAVAGQKEKGTLTGILLTPTPVSTITLGNLCGIWCSAFMPILVTSPVLLAVKSFRTFKGIFGYLILCLTISLLVASITLLVSVISDNIVSAQTAFLPVFFILLAICVMCIQSNDNISSLYLRLPVYGQFYGIGLCLTGEPIGDLDIIICCLTTVLLSGVCIFISDRFLRTERYTTTVDSVSDKKISKIRIKREKKILKGKKGFKDIIFGYTPLKRRNSYVTLVSSVRFPLVVVSITQLLAMIPAVIYMSRQTVLFDMISDLRNIKDMEGIFSAVFDAFELLMAQPVFMLFFGLSYWLLIAIYIIRVKFIERKPLYSTGFGKDIRTNVRNYLTGVVLGLLMLSSSVLILILTGTAKITGFGIKDGMGTMFILYVLMWLPQGASEELMFRGFMIPRLSHKFGRTFAVLFSSLMFGIFHAANKGFSVLALINLFLIALGFALITLYTDSIFMTSAAHTLWNFSQGNLYGLEVSGNTAGASLLQTTYNAGKPAILTGGDFGPEGGISVTIVSLITIVVMLILFKRRSDKEKKAIAS